MRSRLALLALLLAGSALLWWTLDVAAQTTGCTNAATLIDKQMPDPEQPLAPGEAFTVVWELENTGDCTWTRTYRLLPVDGDRMGGKVRYPVSANVRPNRQTTFTLELTAPDAPGYHQSIWRLSDAADGAPFGPWLAIEVQVAEAATAAADDVILPEVLVLGGRGGGGGDYVADPCIVEGVDHTEPALIWESKPPASERSAFGYLCGYPLDAEVTVTLTSPTGESFSRVEYATAGYIYPEEGEEYTRPIAYFAAAWPERAPAGRWLVTVTGAEVVLTDVLAVPEATPPAFNDYPSLITYPVGSIDPFAAAEGCRYAYMPDEQMIIAGANFSRTTTLQLGVYQERAGLEYLVDAFRVTTDRRGEFTKLYAAGEPAENYGLRVINHIDPDAYLEGTEAYDPYLSTAEDNSAWGCFTVKQGPDEPSVYLAYVEGDPGRADVHALNLYGGYIDSPQYGDGVCDTYAPTWWPGGDWLLYSSNCIRPGEGEPLAAATDYDLYAYEVFTWEGEGAPITDSPDVDETEPNVAADGRIVYRRTPVGTPLAADGELWVLSADGEESKPLGISGRAPVWSPAGMQIAYMSDTDGDWRVYLYDLDTGESRLVSTACPTHCRFPAWDPEGDWLLYSTTASTTNFTADGIWAVPADGRDAPVLWLDGPYGRPTWSLSGWIAFNGPDGLYRVREDANPPVPERFLVNAYDPERPYVGPVWSR